MPGFRLRKYYLDCVTDDGAGCIGYAAQLRWGPVRVPYAALIEWKPGAGPVERSTFRQAARPRPGADRLEWRCPGLGVRGCWEGGAAAPRTLLLDGEAGRIEWQVLAPRAAAQVERPDRPLLAGWGYAEVLELTVEPWRLPLDTLHWGRFHAPGHALVWIAWDGPTRLRHVRHNDRELPGEATCTGQSWRFPGCELLFDHTRTLRDAPVAAAVQRLPRVLRRVPPAFLSAREVKWLSEARLSIPGLPPVRGWALHERVQFR